VTCLVGVKDLADFRELVRGRAGMAFPLTRLSDVRRAVERAVAAVDAPSVSSFYEALSGRGNANDALDALVSELNVCET
jgi:hypothetical protein